MSASGPPPQQEMQIWLAMHSLLQLGAAQDVLFRLVAEDQRYLRLVVGVLLDGPDDLR